MKVYIGPYSQFINAYHFVHTVFGWLGEDRCDRIAFHLTDTIFDKFLLSLNNKKRKIKVKLHDYDTWNVDDTLAHIIYPLLLKMREQKNAIPLVDNKDVPKAIRRPAGLEAGEEDENFAARWEYVLNEMIFAFNSIVNFEDEPEFSTGVMDITRIGVDKDGNETDDEDKVSYYKVVHGPNHTYKTDLVAYGKYAKRVQNGFALFGKYYQSLWT